MPQNLAERTKSVPRIDGHHQSLLAAIVDSSDDAIVSKNLDGVITSWNRSAERLFGYTVEEAVGQPVLLIIPPERQYEEAQILERLRRGERIDHFETVRMRKDGTKFEASLTISPVRDALGNVVGASKIARDISDRIRTERALAEQARLLDLSNDAILIRDFSDRITYWNKGASELYGYTTEEAIGQVSHDLLATRFPEPLESIVDKLRQQNRWSGEVQHNHKDGHPIIVSSRWALDRDTNGAARGVLETNNDITEEKRTAKALQDSEAQLSVLAEQLENKVRVRTEELRKLWYRLIRVQEDERRHIARELHDSVGQYLAALGMVLESAKADQPSSLKLKEATKILEASVKEIRTISHLLRPPLLEETGLASAVLWYIEGFAARSGIQVKTEIEEKLGRLGSEAELCLFRVLQESLTNVHRHSGSKTVAIRLGADSERVWLEVEDQGKGNPEGLARPGVGITSMRERVASLAGDLKVFSSSTGTRISTVLPLRGTALSND